MAGFDFTQLGEFEIEYGETANPEIFVTEHETHSLLLGPDGEPLQYETHPIGFILKHRQG